MLSWPHFSWATLYMHATQRAENCSATFIQQFRIVSNTRMTGGDQTVRHANCCSDRSTCGFGPRLIRFRKLINYRA